MGFIEEGRQLIQDFVIPEIRSLDARLIAIEKRVELLDASIDKRFDAVDKRLDSFKTEVEKRFDTLDSKIDRNQAQVLETLHRIKNYSHVLERLARLETKLQNVA